MTDPDTNSVDPQGNPGTPPAEAPRDTNLIPQVPPSIAHKPERSYSNPDPTPPWKIVLEIGAVAVGIVVACIYYGQLKVMQGQLGEIVKQFPEIQKSAKAARDSADLSRQTLVETVSNFRTDQRAWLAPEFIKEPEQINQSGLAIENLSVGNSGKTQALQVHGQMMVMVIPKETKHLPFAGARTMPFNPSVIYAGRLPQVYGVPIYRQLANGRLGGVTWDQINPQLRGTDQAFLFGYGKISYYDIFGNTKHVVTFCTMLVGGFAQTKVGEPLSGANLRQQCSDYNRAYDEH